MYKYDDLPCGPPSHDCPVRVSFTRINLKRCFKKVVTYQGVQVHQIFNLTWAAVICFKILLHKPKNLAKILILRNSFSTSCDGYFLNDSNQNLEKTKEGS